MILKLLKIIPKQANEVYPIICECGKYMKEKFNLTHWYPPYSYDIMLKHINEKEVYGIKEEEYNQIIATFTIDTKSTYVQYNKQFWHKPDDIALYLSKLAVLPSYQGNGIGTWCMYQIESLAKEKKCSAVRFDALLQHKLIINFYMCKLSYSIVDIVEEKDPYQENTKWRLAVFEKVLTNSNNC